MVPTTRLAFSVLSTTALVVFAVRKKSLSGDGLLAAVAVGLITSLGGGFGASAALYSFFLAGSLATRVGAHVKRRAEDGYAEGGQRTARQVLCNGGPPSVALLLLCASRGWAAGDASIDYRDDFAASAVFSFVLAYYCACAGDTLSSEFGILSRGDPRLITAPWRVVPRGTNGGVSAVGTVAAGAGGFLVGACYGLCAPTAAPIWEQTLRMSSVGAVLGVCGSVLDSLLGACLQASVYSSTRKVVLKNSPSQPERDTRHVSGLNILDNDQVRRNIFLQC